MCLLNLSKYNCMLLYSYVQHLYALDKDHTSFSIFLDNTITYL